MYCYAVQTPQRRYEVRIERGLARSAGLFVPASRGTVFVLSTEDVWALHGKLLEEGLREHPHKVLFYPGGEERKRLSTLESLAEQMIAAGGDRTSVILAFGGGIVTDVGGFLAASFMRGIPVVQVPTTLLAQVDASVGGKTGVNLACGKNLVGAFHQPLAVVIDPDVLVTLSEREYRAGLFEVIKCGVISSPGLFALLRDRHADVVARRGDVVEQMIAESVRIKTEVVTADEREGDLRRILNFGHTYGHALEAETGYSRFLHGEAVAFGMSAATHLARLLGMLDEKAAREIQDVVRMYGPIPPLGGISAAALVARLKSDKKTLKGDVHFVLPEAIGRVKVVSQVDSRLVLEAAEAALG
jgi:3-dehydroquinate synthase